MKEGKSGRILILESNATMARSIAALIAPRRGGAPAIFKSVGAALEFLEGKVNARLVLLNTQFGSEHYLGRQGLKFACYDLRLSASIKEQPNILLYSFESLDSLQAYSREEFGVDMFSIAGIYFLRLPFLIKDWRKLIDIIARSQGLKSQALEVELQGVRHRLVKKILRDFDHTCRNLTQDDRGWKTFKDTLLPGFESALKRIEREEQRFFIQEREALREIAASQTAMFESVYAALRCARTIEAQTFTLKQITNAGVPVTKEATAAFSTTVMLVEDDSGFADRISDFLTGAGHRVIHIADPRNDSRQIIHAVQSEKAKVVLLDLEFGTIEKGFKILKELKKKAPDLKVLMITGYGGENIIKAKAFGADDFIRKPVVESVLLDKIKEALAERRVLFIDDEVEEVLTPDLVMTFESKRCKIYSYADPRQAFDDIKDQKIPLESLSLVILDLKFNGSFEKGYDAFKQLKGLRNDLRIFFLTGYSTDDIILQIAYGKLKDYFKPPQDEFLTKPLDDEGMGKIWRALFPKPTKLVLRQKSSSVEVFEASGTLLAKLKYQPKQWFLIYWLATKMEKGLAGINVKSSQDDKELEEVSKTLGYHTSWDESSLRENISRINKKARETTGLEIELINNSDMLIYSLCEPIRVVEKKN